MNIINFSVSIPSILGMSTYGEVWAVGLGSMGYP